MKRKSTTLRDETESEIEFQSLFVTNYHLEDNYGEPVCFSVLPFKWSSSKVSKVDDTEKGLKIFLHGSADNGLQTIFMQVTAWKFELTGLKPEVSLLSKDKRWIKIQKPRKSFQKTVKTALITLYFLRCAKKNPRLSVESFWSNMCKDKDLSSYGFKPSQKDLLDHMSLIGEATTRDIGLAHSKLLLSVLGDKPGDQKPSDEEFDANNDIIEESDEDSKVEDDLFDSFCALCDNGGNLIMCDGACMRSFHATKADGRESLCDSLGFTKKEVDDIETFYCKNCEYRQHQCFACGELGSSDKDKDAEVFKCASETCDRFYHPHCIAPLVKHVSEDLEKNNADGQTFSCPIHFCFVCKGLENKMDPELQFAVCNRCPKSYHRKCLPTEIAFDDIDDVATRAWEGLLPNNRILIYCLNHEISDELGTPVRDHIKFPDTRASVWDINTSNKKMKPTTTEGVKLKSNVDFVKSSDKSTAERSKVTGKLPSSKICSKKSSGETSDKLETPVRDHIKFPDTRVTVPEINTNKRVRPTTTERVELKSNVGFVKSSGKSTAEGSKVTGKLPSSKIGSKKSSGETSDKLETPVRDHIKFPDTRATVSEINTSNKRMRPTTTERVELKNNVGFVKSSGKSTAEGSKVTGKLPSKTGSKKSTEKIVSGSDISRTPESKEMSSKCLTEYKSTSKNSSEKVISCSDISRNPESNKISLTEENKKSNSKLSGKVISGSHISSKPKSNERSKTVLTKNKKPMPKCEVKKHPTGQKLCASMNKGSEQIKHDNQVDGADNRTLSIMPVRSVLPPPDADSEKGFVDSFKEARSSISMEGVIKKHKLGDVEDKAITMRKLDDSVDLTTKHKVLAQEHGHMYSDKLAAKNIMESKLDDSVDLTTKQKVIAQEHGHMYGDKLAAENIMDGDSGDKLMPNHDLLKSTDDQELPSVNESKKKSSHDGNADQESQDKQGFKMSKSLKISGKRKRIDKNDRKAIEKHGRDSSHVNKHSARFAAARKLKFATGQNVKYAPIHSGGWLEE